MIDPILYAVFFGIGAVAVILVYITKNVIPIHSFIYANARVQARSTASDRKMQELAESKNISEFMGALPGYEFPSTELREIHLAIENGFARSVNDLMEIVPKKSLPVFQGFIMLVEIGVLKNIYRALMAGKKPDEKVLLPIGSITPSLLKRLLDAQTAADMAVIMSRTEYAPVFARKYETVEELEAALEQFVLQKFTAELKIYDAKSVMEVLDMRVDIVNILTLMKAKIREVSAEKFLIKNSSPLSKRFKQLLAAEDPRSLINALKGLPYYDVIGDDIGHVELKLMRYYKSRVLGNELYRSLGPYPLLAYTIKKDFERKNLFAISTGIIAGLSAAEIKEMII